MMWLKITALSSILLSCCLSSAQDMPAISSFSSDAPDPSTLPVDLLKTCLKKFDNAREVDRALRNQNAASDCKSQVRESYEICGRDPMGNNFGAEIKTPVIALGAEALRAQ